MKTIFTLFMAMLTTWSVAQNGINYKAVIKDNNGNVIANQQIDVRFSILKGVAQAVVYSETHAPTTDNIGIIIVNIGEGTPSIGVFKTVDWGSDSHYLEVGVNTGSGLVVLGTTEFKSVPYALNVTGLVALDEGNGIGWRLKGHDPINYANIGENAVDLSYAAVPIGILGATGSNSIAMGSNTIASGFVSTATGAVTLASGFASTAMGSESRATGDYSTALGYSTRASGDSSFASGYDTSADGISSTAMGRFTHANNRDTFASGYTTSADGEFSTAMGFATNSESFGSMAIGRNNIGGGNPTSWVPTDPLFEIGNGTNSSRANALKVLKNGKMYLTPIIDDASLSDGSGYLIIGKEDDINLVFDGNELMARDNGSNSPFYVQRDGGNGSTC